MELAKDQSFIYENSMCRFLFCSVYGLRGERLRERDWERNMWKRWQIYSNTAWRITSVHLSLISMKLHVENRHNCFFQTKKTCKILNGMLTYTDTNTTHTYTHTCRSFEFSLFLQYFRSEIEDIQLKQTEKQTDCNLQMTERKKNTFLIIILSS